MNKRVWFMLCAMLALLAAMLACNFTPQEETNTDDVATVEAEQTALASTMTALAVLPVQPVATQPPVVETQPPVQAEPPTAAAPAVTEAPAAPAAPEAPAATQPPVPGGAPPVSPEDVGRVQAELPKYGVDPQRGSLAWVQGPLVMESNGYRGSKFGNQYPMVVAQDFVLSADITWDTQYGGAGCGFVFRSDGNQQSPNNYMMMSTRLAEGHAFFAVNAQGQMMIVKEFYANGIDPQFDASNGSTNRLTVVGRGSLFDIYSNDRLLGQVDPNKPLPALNLPKPPARSAFQNDAAYQQAVAAYKATVNKLKAEYEKRRALWNTLKKDFPAGIVAMGAAADSGRTECEFNNAWLWLIAP